MGGACGPQHKRQTHPAPKAKPGALWCQTGRAMVVGVAQSRHPRGQRTTHPTRSEGCAGKPNHRARVQHRHAHAYARKPAHTDAQPKGIVACISTGICGRPVGGFLDTE